jgi:hypothetical protein
VISVGFTGTRNPVTSLQRSRIYAELIKAKALHVDSELHHGSCQGADATAHQLAWVMGYRIVAHPPTDQKLRAWVEFTEYWDQDTDVLLPELSYLERNLAIVKAVDLLIVVPAGPYRIRSGTWWTFSAAKREGVPTIVIQPDGTVE